MHAVRVQFLLFLQAALRHNIDYTFDFIYKEHHYKELEAENSQKIKAIQGTAKTRMKN